MPLTHAALTHWTHRIRAHLTPALNNPLLAPAAVLPPSTLEDLHAFFRELGDTTLTAPLLRGTRVHRALLEIAEPGGGWPEGLGRHADALLARWRGLVREVGCRDLWGPGGRMAGCLPVAGVEEDPAVMLDAGLEPRAGAREWWAVSGAKGEERALQTGHVGFHVGECARTSSSTRLASSVADQGRSWWVHPIAAYRDGIVGQPGGGITTDGERVYAVLLMGDEEVAAGTSAGAAAKDDEDGEVDAIVYRPRPRRACRTKLCSARTAVRVLRAATGDEVGVRYAGLYHIARWSLQLVRDAKRHRPWHQFTFVLVPAPPEPPPLHASVFPPPAPQPATGDDGDDEDEEDDDNAHEEDWREYAASLAENAVSLQQLIADGWCGELVWLETDDVPAGAGALLPAPERRDSGYVSGGAEPEGRIAGCRELRP